MDAPQQNWHLYHDAIDRENAAWIRGLSRQSDSSSTRISSVSYGMREPIEAIASGSTVGIGNRNSPRGKDSCKHIPNWTEFAVNEPLQTTLVDAARFLEGQRVPYVLIDGLAASVHGQPCG